MEQIKEALNRIADQLDTIQKEQTAPKIRTRS
jgi:hypothetical protein